MGILKYFVVKKELEIEIQRLKSVLDIERKKLEAEFDILATKKTMALTEAMKMAKIEMEDKLNKQATFYNESLQKLQLIHAKEISALESKLVKEYYEKMTEVLRELNLEGNVQTKFVQELSLKMFDKALEKPVPSHFINERIISSKE